MDSNNDSEIIDRGNIRPWVRYWARTIDMYLLITLIFTLQKIFFPTKELNLNIVLVGMYLLWMLIEAQLLATWGTTPGKWLLKTKVRDANYEKLTMKTALFRGFFVWVFGMGLTIFTHIAEIIAYFNLQNSGITLWDKYFKCNVIHEEFGTERIPLIIAVIVIPRIIYEIL